MHAMPGLHNMGSSHSRPVHFQLQLQRSRAISDDLSSKTTGHLIRSSGKGSILVKLVSGADGELPKGPR